ncbi:MAG: alpha/beta fold hydrolase [Acidimicrobiales bacterium]
MAVHDLNDDLDGRPVLFCHATGFCGPVFGPVARHLDGVRALALDFRGHGDTVTPPEAPLDPIGFADDLLAVIDGLDLGPTFGVGHSLGGGALLRAEQSRPGRLAAMFLFEPIAFPRFEVPRPSEPNQLAIGARRRREVFPSFEAAYDNFASKPPLDALDPEALRAYVWNGFAAQDDGSVRLKCPGKREARIFETGPTLVDFDRLGEVACPVTVAAGGDGDPPAAIAPLIADQLPNGTFRQIDTVGHFGPLEDPPLLAEAISEAFGLTR